MAVINFPDPAGQTPVNTFSPTSTPASTSNGVSYVWTNGSWSIAGVGDGADDRYVNVVGDDMSGNLTLGTDKITLDATGGSGTFAGEVKSDKFVEVTTGSTGAYFCTSTDVTNDGRGAFTCASSTGRTFLAKFNGDTLIGGDVAGNNPNIHLNNDGSATFAGQLTANQAIFKGYHVIEKTSGDSNFSIFRVRDNGQASGKHILSLTQNRLGIGANVDYNANNAEIRLGTNGSASFAGLVTFNGGTSGVTGRAIELNGDIGIQLEPDNPANYVSTMIDGEETQVYSGPTLDVKERLTKTKTALETLKSAAAASTDFAELKAAIATALAEF